MAYQIAVQAVEAHPVLVIAYQVAKQMTARNVVKLYVVALRFSGVVLNKYRFIGSVPKISSLSLMLRF